VNRLLLHNAVLRENFDTVFAIKESLKAENYHDAIMYFNDLTDEEKRALWISTRAGGIWTPQERKKMKSNEWVRVRNEGV